MSEVTPNAPAQAAAPAPVPAPQAPEPQTFSVDYVRELRAENKGWRLKHTEAENAARAAAEAKAAAEKARDEAVAAAKAEADTAKADAEKRANDRVVRAELKAAALKAGMVDLDGLKLADLSKVTLDESGEVQGADALMADLKAAKPYLFGAPVGTSSTQTPPPPKSASGPKKASEMSDVEYRAALKAIEAGRPV